MNTKNITITQIRDTLALASANDLEDTITVEQVTQLHNALSVSDPVKALVESIKDSVAKDKILTREILVDKMSDIYISLGNLSISLGLGITEISKASHTKIQKKNPAVKRVRKDKVSEDKSEE